MFKVLLGLVFAGSVAFAQVSGHSINVTQSGGAVGCVNFFEIAANGGNKICLQGPGNLGSDYTVNLQGAAHTIAAINLDNNFTVDQTFQGHILFSGNDAKNVGSTSNRPHYVFGYNADFAPAGGTGNAVYGRVFQVVDALGATTAWNIQANASVVTSKFQIRDGSGVLWLDMVRAQPPSLVPNAAKMDSHLNPSTDATYHLGDVGLRWDANLRNVNITGTCTGCGSTTFPISDATNLLFNAADASKILKFDLSAISPSTTRILAPKDASYTIAGSNLDNSFSTDQTFQNNILFSTNDFSTVGSISKYAHWVYSYNGDFAPGGSTGNTVSARVFKVVDSAGGSAGWTIQASAGLGSSFQIKDNSGNSWLNMVRTAVPSLTPNAAQMDSHLDPMVDAAYSLGTPLLRWDANLRNVNITGTCTGCSTASSPDFEIKMQDYACDGSSHPLTSGQLATYPNANSAIIGATLAAGDEKDYASIMDAIGKLIVNSHPFLGGKVIVPAGVCISNHTVDMGNGNSSVHSSINGIILEGQGSGKTRHAIPIGAPSVIKYTGAASTSAAVIRFNGPAAGLQVRDIGLEANNLAGMGIDFMHAYNSTLYDVLIQGPTQWGVWFHSYQTHPQVGVGAMDNTIDKLMIKEIQTCTAGGVKLGNDTDTGSGILAVSRTNFRDLFVVGDPTCAGGGAGTAIELRWTDSESFIDTYTLFMSKSVNVHPATTASGLAVGPTQVTFRDSYLNVTPTTECTTVGSVTTCWTPTENAAIRFDNYVQDGGAPAFPLHPNMQGYTNNTRTYGNPRFMAPGTGFSDAATIISAYVGSGNAGCLTYKSTNTVTANTSMPGYPNNEFFLGRLCGLYDSTGLTDGRMTFSNYNRSSSTWVDAMSIKNSFVGIHDTNPAYCFSVATLTVMDCSGNITHAGILSSGLINIPTSTNWNSFQTVGGGRFSKTVYAGFGTSFDPIGSPHSIYGHVVNTTDVFVHLEREGGLALFVADAYQGGGGAVGGMKARYARGTISSPTPPASGDTIGSFGAEGAILSGATNAIFANSNNAAVSFIAAESFGSSTRGAGIAMQTTANGTSSRRTVASFWQDGTLIIGPSQLTSANGGLKYEPTTHKLQYSNDLITWQDVGSAGGGTYTGTSPIVVSGSAISCPTCLTSAAAVTSVSSGGNGVLVSPTTGAVSVSLDSGASVTLGSLTTTGNIGVSGTLTTGGAVVANGGISTASGSNSAIYIGSSGNLYIRTFGGLGTLSCSGVTDGWMGINTTTNDLYVCVGGNAKKVTLF